MRAFLAFIEAAIWSAYLDDNEWWLMGKGRTDPWDPVNPVRR